MKTTALWKTLTLLLFLCISLPDSLAQRRGKRGGKERKLEIMKNICCYFVNDNQLTKTTKEAIRKDAFALSKIVLEKELGRKIEEQEVIEELAILIYNGLVYIRLEGGQDLQELNALAIRKGAVYEDYKTDITLELINLDNWILNYSFSFQEGGTWQTKHWEINLVYCEFTYQLTTHSTIDIPLLIQQQALERAVQEIKSH